jgi:hypothetical protein
MLRPFNLAYARLAWLRDEGGLDLLERLPERA